MEARSRSSSVPVLPLTFAFQRSHSPTRHFNSPSSSSALNFSVNRTLSPTRTNFSSGSSYSSASSAASSSINFGQDKSASQVHEAHSLCSPPRKTCMCSPTNHPGSFRCSLHRNSNISSSSTHSHLNARRSAMTNSLVRIPGVERIMDAKRPHGSYSPLQPPHAKGSSFQPRPSRLCHMTTAQDIF